MFSSNILCILGIQVKSANSDNCIKYSLNSLRSLKNLSCFSATGSNLISPFLRTKKPAGKNSFIIIVLFCTRSYPIYDVLSPFISVTLPTKYRPPIIVEYGKNGERCFSVVLKPQYGQVVFLPISAIQPMHNAIFTSL